MDITHVSNCIETAQALKQEGNEYFKAKDYTKALGRYTRIIAYVTGLTKDKSSALSTALGVDLSLSSLGESSFIDKTKPLTLEDELLQEARDLELVAYNNITMCYLQLENYTKALTFANKVLSASPNNTKGLFRKAKALYYLQQSHEALAIIEKLIDIQSSPANNGDGQPMTDGNLATIDPATRQLHELIKRQVNKADKSFAANFRKAMQLSSSPPPSSSSS